jgi:hypothetical protein
MTWHGVLYCYANAMLWCAILFLDNGNVKYGNMYTSEGVTEVHIIFFFIFLQVLNEYIKKSSYLFVCKMSIMSSIFSHEWPLPSMCFWVV